jgi:hypothetical protein
MFRNVLPTCVWVSSAGCSVDNRSRGVFRSSPEMSAIDAHGGSVCGIKNKSMMACWMSQRERM